MTLGPICFVLFLCSVGLVFWRPEGGAGTALRMLVWMGLGFMSTIGLLFALFTVWWPPAQTWAVIWSVASIIALLVAMVSSTHATDWLG
ncbi:MAG: hypothetical protein EHM87_17945 [Burkholderiales bacterium]|nr:MAG: hypothetical protein EHM87_17945 [Burkholderiales bacterium]